jgi:hypothetical protein
LARASKDVPEVALTRVLERPSRPPRGASGRGAGGRFQAKAGRSRLRSHKTGPCEFGREETRKVETECPSSRAWASGARKPSTNDEDRQDDRSIQGRRRQVLRRAASRRRLHARPPARRRGVVVYDAAAGDAPPAQIYVRAGDQPAPYVCAPHLFLDCVAAIHIHFDVLTCAYCATNRTPGTPLRLRR